MKSDEAVAAEQAVEAKLAEAGADHLRQMTPAEAAPEKLGTPAEEPVEAADVEETVAPEATPGDDPAISALLAKYGGDINKALQAAVQAQRKLGEMGNELGQKRQENSEYERIISELADLKQQINQPTAPQVPDQQTVDWLDEQIALNPAAAPQYAAQALQANQPLLYQRIMRQWFDHDPYAATEFSNQIRFEQVKQELQQQAPRDENVQMQAALTQVLSEHPEFDQYAGDLEATISRYPAAAAGLRGTQEEKKQAIETLFALAERDTLRAIALSGQTPAAPSATTEVATATTSQEHPDEAPAPPKPLDVFREQFRQEAARYSGERAIPNAYVAR